MKNKINRIASYLPFVCYLLLNFYCIGIYFPTMNEESSLAGILLWYVLPILGVFMLGFLFMFVFKRYKSISLLDRQIQFILYTIFNSLESILFSLVLLSLPNMTRMYILFLLLWVFVPVSQYLAMKSYQESKGEWKPNTKNVSFAFSFILVCSILSLFAILLFNLNKTQDKMLSLESLIPFDIPFLIASCLCLVFCFAFSFFHKKKDGINNLFIFSVLVIICLALLFTFVECLFRLGTQVGDFNALSSGVVFFLSLILFFSILVNLIRKKKMIA